jgi:outer membrane biosynthesis protein TonB
MGRPQPHLTSSISHGSDAEGGGVTFAYPWVALAEASQSPGETIHDSLPGEPTPAAAPLADPRARWRTGAAIASALLLHLAIIVLLLVKLGPETPTEPTPIPVELAFEPPKPAAQAIPKPAPQPRPSESEPRHRESGGDPNLAPGIAPADAPSSKVPAPEPAKAPIGPKPVTPAPLLASLGAASDLAKPAKPAAPKLETREAMIPVPPPRHPPAPASNRSMQLGEGGGDRYLNTLRDDLLRHRAAAILADAATITHDARYKIVIARDGKLLGASLLQSSGNSIVDEAGFNMIENTAPFRPVPPDFPGDPVVLQLTLFPKP